MGHPDFNVGAVTILSSNNNIGSVSISQATPTVTNAVYVTNIPSTPVVEVLNFPTSQTISGSVTVSNFPATPVVEVLNFPATQIVSISQATPGTTNAVYVTDFTSTPTVEVLNFPITQSISISQTTPITTNGIVLTDANGQHLTLEVDGPEVLSPGIDDTHIMIHDGWMFEYGNNITITNVSPGGNIALTGFVTGSKQAHLKPRIYYSAVTTLSSTPVAVSIAGTLVEDPSVVTLGAAASPYNLNRVIASTPLTNVYPSTTVVVGGTTLSTIIIPPGNSTSIGNSYISDYELVLAPNTQYVFSYQNFNSSDITGSLAYRIAWYEVTSS